MGLSEKVKAKEALIHEVKTIAGYFANLIIQRHIEWRKTGVDYTADDLVAGTKYEGVVQISGSTVVWSVPGHQFVWLYIPRNEDETANLIEFSGFK
ncbi:MAG: hypothetical protein V3U75_11690 [Methylococcaceae bacterium]